MTVDVERAQKEEKSDTRRAAFWTSIIVVVAVALGLLVYNSFEARATAANTAAVAKSTAKTITAIRKTQKDTHTSVTDIENQTAIITNAITALNQAYANIQHGADEIVANQAAICNFLAADHVIPKCVLPAPTV